MNPILQQFDQAEIITTKRVSYLSDRPGHSTNPHGIWNVVGIVDGEALLAKESALIRIPINDVKKTSTYNPSEVIDKLRSILPYGKENSQKIEGEGGEKRR